MTLLERLKRNLRTYNEEAGHEFKVALSIGAIEIDHEEVWHIEDQMARADEMMYREKRKKKGRMKVASKI